MRKQTYQYPIALTIAGSDSGGGAGIQADIKTFSALGVYGASAITAITAQNTQGVRDIQAVTPDLLRGQIEAVLEDLPVNAIKIGMLYNPAAARVVAETLPPHHTIPIVLDPVMVATSGDRLLEDAAIRTIIDELFPQVTLLTPNLPEAEYLSGVSIQDEEDILCAARRLRGLGCEAVLIKGGHLTGADRSDWLFQAGRDPIRLTAPHIHTPNTHGTGCTLSSAIAAHLALGKDLDASVRSAKRYLTQALSTGANVRVGQGHGPVDHFFAPLALHKIAIPPCVH